MLFTGNFQLLTRLFLSKDSFLQPRFSLLSAFIVITGTSCVHRLLQNQQSSVYDLCIYKYAIPSSRNSTALLISFLPDYTQFTKFNFSLFHPSPITRSSRNSTSPLLPVPYWLRAVHEIQLPHYYPPPTDCTQFTKFNFFLFRSSPITRSSRNSTSPFFVPPQLHAVHEIQLLVRTPRHLVDRFVAVSG